MTYRLSITLLDNRIVTEFAQDELSGLAWMESGCHASNIFNSYGYWKPYQVRHVSITGSESPMKARAAWYKRWRSA